VSAVVEAPFGCHPTSSHGYYTFDEGQLKSYLKSCKDAESYAQYFNEYVTGITEEEYNGKIGVSQLEQLRNGGESK
jgi:glutaconate CoA-transferase subunit A